MFQHAFSMLLYGMFGYAVILALLVILFSSGALRFWQSEPKIDNLEQTIRGWLDGSGLSTTAASDPTWNFGLLATLPDGDAIYIIQMKEHQRFIVFRANLAISPEHQLVLQAMPATYLRKLAQEVGVRLFLAKMVNAFRTRLSDFSLFSQLAIANTLKEEQFLKHFDDMHKAIILARHTILLGVESARRGWDEKADSVSEARPACGQCSTD